MPIQSDRIFRPGAFLCRFQQFRIEIDGGDVTDSLRNDACTESVAAANF